MNTAQIKAPVKILNNFISSSQLAAMVESCDGEEGEYFIEKLAEMANQVSTMPKTYEQDGLGDDAIVHLHYFKGAMDWYITERDMEDDQLQAFGLADLGMGFPEIGYISISEIIANGVELDLHWTPKKLGELA